MMKPCERIDALERHLQEADLRTPPRRPWIPRERDEIIRVARQCLGVRERWIPRIDTRVSASISRANVTLQMLCATSWTDCFCAAHLYLPAVATAAPLPLVLLCCGHGRGGKQAEGYRRMAWRLACMGSAVLVPDNIGQGERIPMGHRDVVAPFRCGLSLQGLIVMETMGWLRWALADGRFDRHGIAAIGNSGGGVLTLFLGALCREDLAVLSSSGYPSTFAFIAAKEKKHCHCNILPGIVGSLRMWQLYGCFAPKPAFLFQGQMDHLFPEDLFDITCRKVRNAYRNRGADSALETAVFPGGHSWDDERTDSLAAFLRKALRFDSAHGVTEFAAEACRPCFETWPRQALTTDELAAQISGIQPPPEDALHQVYFPELEGIPDVEFRRVGMRQLAAQQQAFLNPDMRLPNTDGSTKPRKR